MCASKDLFDVSYSGHHSISVKLCELFSSEVKPHLFFLLSNFIRLVAKKDLRINFNCQIKLFSYCSWLAQLVLISVCNGPLERQCMVH